MEGVRWRLTKRSYWYQFTDAIRLATAKKIFLTILFTFTLLKM